MNTNHESYTGQGARVRVSDNQDPQRYTVTEENFIDTPENVMSPDNDDDFLRNDQDGFYPNDQNNPGLERSQNTDDDDDFIINHNDDDFIINSTDDDNLDDEENLYDQESDNSDLDHEPGTDVNRNEDDSIFGGTNRNESL